MDILLDSLEAPQLKSHICKFPEAAASFGQLTSNKISLLNFEKVTPAWKYFEYLDPLFRISYEVCHGPMVESSNYTLNFI